MVDAVYTPLLKPRAHQQVGLDKMVGKAAFALFMAQRCVDGLTEYLSPTGWRRMTDYDGGMVAEFRLDGTAHFVQPLDVIKSLVDHFWHLKTMGGVDQVLSDHHRMLLCHQDKPTFGKIVGRVPNGYRNRPSSLTDFWLETSPVEGVTAWKRRRTRAKVPLTFNLEHENSIDMTDAEIRLMVAFHADGSFNKRDLSKVGPNKKGYVRIKKEVKKARLRAILAEVGIPYKEVKALPEGFSVFSFMPSRRTKTYGPEWWNASEHQRRLICNEVAHWDGRTVAHRADAKHYSSIHEGDADFVQFCFVSTGQRATKAGRCGDGTFKVNASGHGRASNLATTPVPVPYEGPTDGFMYSFAVPSTYLVLRRSGKVFVTGNTGKSSTALNDFGRLELAGQAHDFLEISRGGVYASWKTAMLGDAVTGEPGHLSADLAKRIVIHVWKSTGGKAHDKAFENFLKITDRPRALLMNVEAISSMDRARKALLAYVQSQGRRVYAVIDESLIIANPSSERTKFINGKLRDHCDFRRILCGLPTPRDPMQLYAQFQFLDWTILGHRSFFSFRNRYAVMRSEFFGGRTVQIIVGFRNTEELQELIAPHTHRVLLEDVYDMPAKTHAIRAVEMTPEQVRLYAEMKAFATMTISETEHVTATIVITQMLRLHQLLCGYTTDDQGTIHYIPTNRTRVLLEVIEEYDGKAVIWCAYDHGIRTTTDALEKEYGKGSVARWWGGNRNTREDEERIFKSDPKCRFMVSTAAAGGRGREWSCADLTIFSENSKSNDDRQQAEDRVQAVGKIKSNGYIDLVARKPDGSETVDGMILKALREDMDLSDLVTGDSWRAWVV